MIDRPSPAGPDRVSSRAPDIAYAARHRLARARASCRGARAEGQLDGLRPEVVAVDRVVDVRRRCRRGGAARRRRCGGPRPTPRTSPPGSPRGPADPASSRQAACQVVRRMDSTSIHASAARCCTAWKLAIGRSNCLRSRRVLRGDAERPLDDAELERAQPEERAVDAATRRSRDPARGRRGRRRPRRVRPRARAAPAARGWSRPAARASRRARTARRGTRRPARRPVRAGTRIAAARCAAGTQSFTPSRRQPGAVAHGARRAAPRAPPPAARPARR